MHKIVVLDRDTIAPEVNVRRPSFPHEWIEYPRTGAAEVVERARDATILINNKVELRAGTLEQLPDLALIAISATGTDCVDKAAAAVRGVPTVNIRGYARATVPEHTFALLLALARSIVPYRQEVIDGAWQAAQQFCFFTNPIIDLSGKRIGIVGAGVLGSQVAGIARAFGMEVVFYDPMAKPGTDGVVSLAELIETAHVVTLHCPLTDATRGLLDLAAFRRMKQRPIIINTARGGLIIEEYLEIALDEGLVSAAGLDVTLPEPPAADSAFMRLARRKNVICTPHVAWASLEAQQALADQLIDNIENFVAGKPSNVVSPD
ncbi:D-2-hydroxyacid dehydrogenase [Ancylobacter sp. 6x-1]|uniref:D-2-hydroxyacid dehydrogenase n=1 Tax=Ancylobacter crimeensis TaxID=2579147 RepID=A0ABT0D765_9HYPH|nr:D-2-hydroxyacid dehydrogenase [Ancylobacter crimeensis]MCK0195772.1 D-2-hydroxyacid dehydrogenase [Ancylobacter crimeensis]